MIHALEACVASKAANEQCYTQEISQNLNMSCQKLPQPQMAATWMVPSCIKLKTNSGDQHQTPCKRLQHYRQPLPLWIRYPKKKKRHTWSPGNPSVKATAEKPTPKLQQCNCICRVQLDPIEGFNPRDPEVSWSPSPKKIVLWFYARPSEYWSWLAGQIAASPGPVAKQNVTRLKSLEDSSPKTIKNVATNVTFRYVQSVSVV